MPLAHTGLLSALEGSPSLSPCHARLTSHSTQAHNLSGLCESLQPGSPRRSVRLHATYANSSPTDLEVRATRRLAAEGAAGTNGVRPSRGGDSRAAHLRRASVKGDLELTELRHERVRRSDCAQLGNVPLDHLLRLAQVLHRDHHVGERIRVRRGLCQRVLQQPATRRRRAYAYASRRGGGCGAASGGKGGRAR